MAIAFVPASKNFGVTSTGSLTLAPAANTVAGNAIILMAFANGTSLGPFTVIDPDARSPEVLLDSSFSGDANKRMGIFVYPNERSIATSEVFAIILAGATGEITVHLLEYSGVATSSVSDGASHDWYNGTLSATGDPGAISTTVADDLIIGMSAQPNGNTTHVTAGTGYTKEVSSLVIGFECDTEDQVVSGTGSFDPTWTYDANFNWYCSAGAIKPATVADTLMGQSVL